MEKNTGLSQAVSFIAHHQDGEIAETLRYRGLQYNMIYGVSSSLLYSYAKQAGKDQEVANKLWNEQYREAKLLSFMLADPEIITDEQVEIMIRESINHEMVEIGTMHLFSKLPNAIEKAYTWILSDKEFVKMAGYMTLSHCARLKKDITIEFFEPFLSQYAKDFTHTSFFVRKSLVNSFQEVAFRKPGIKNSIIQVTKTLLEQNKGTEFEAQATDMLHVLNYC